VTNLNSVIETELYLARAGKLMSEVERETVVDMIAANPAGGVVIPGTGGLRKMRIPLQGRGKRGGGRVIYWFYSENFPVVLLLAFAKNEAEDISPDRRRKLMALGAVLLEQLGGRK
jgi:hypothetical protein